MRISKSTIVNLSHVYALTQSISGCSIQFANTHKQVYVSRRYYKLLRERMKEVREKYDEKKFWGVLLILAAIALIISRLGLKYSVPLGFWQVVGTLFFGAGLIEGLSKKKIGTSVFRLLFC